MKATRAITSLVSALVAITGAGLIGYAGLHDQTMTAAAGRAPATLTHDSAVTLFVIGALCVVVGLIMLGVSEWVP